MSKFPIAPTALDDRLGFLGTSGSGKTYAASSAVEQLLTQKARVVIIDPLGVWWGLRLLHDGKTPSGYDVVIFGGPHGDLPLTENAGAVLGETAGSVQESCIVDLSEFPTKASEVRFMTAFLEAIYRKARGDRLFHLVVDEADLFAPQKPQAGEEVLLNRMEQIVRRGRVRGFIPWLITQRPAVINKNVLSQVAGLVAFQLTSSQDRGALDAWIGGQADEATGKSIKAKLPAMQRGQAVLWLPARSILETVQFPRKTTFDSSRAPGRGEKAVRRALPALDVGALRERLVTVEADTKANDPRALKTEIKRLEVELAQKGVTPSSAELEGAKRHAYTEGYDKGLRNGVAAALARAKEVIEGIDFGKVVATIQPMPAASLRLSLPTPAPSLKKIDAPITAISVPPRVAPDGLTGPQRKILDSLAWWRGVGIEAPKRVQVAFVAGYKPGSGNFNNLLSQLASGGSIEYPRAGLVSLTANGAAMASGHDIAHANPRDAARAILNGAQTKLFDRVIEVYPQSLTREELAAAAGYSAGSGNFNNLCSSLSSLEIVEYPSRGLVKAADWLFEGQRARFR